MRQKRPAHWHLHPGLYDRLVKYAEKEDRTLTAIVEQALAEYLAVPLANRDLPEQPVELCPKCERTLIRQGRCRHCGWRRHWRDTWRPPARARAYEQEVQEGKWAKR